MSPSQSTHSTTGIHLNLCSIPLLNIMYSTTSSLASEAVSHLPSPVDLLPSSSSAAAILPSPSSTSTTSTTSSTKVPALVSADTDDSIISSSSDDSIISSSSDEETDALIATAPAPAPTPLPLTAPYTTSPTLPSTPKKKLGAQRTPQTTYQHLQQMQNLSLVEQSATVLSIDEVMMVAAAEEEVGGGGMISEGGMSEVGEAQHPVIEENFGIVSPASLIVPA